jgi:hypothetical protein
VVSIVEQSTFDTPHKIADGCGLSSDRAESSTRWNRIIDQPADKEGFTLAIPKPMPAVRIEHVEKAQA